MYCCNLSYPAVSCASLCSETLTSCRLLQNSVRLCGKGAPNTLGAVEEVVVPKTEPVHTRNNNNNNNNNTGNSHHEKGANIILQWSTILVVTDILPYAGGLQSIPAISRGLKESVGGVAASLLLLRRGHVKMAIVPLYYKVSITSQACRAFFLPQTDHT
ncbi:hypothetical protein J6590_014570 [Homalodisca vitripennis]|nr:hypothetical protein J6590_014570 [Homalodisca vitripennis]